MKMQDTNSLALAHRAVAEQIAPGQVWVDATAGRGKDALFLCRLVGEQGHVIAFDIQPEAIAATKALLQGDGMAGRCTVLLANHARMAEFVKEPIDGAVFNFGWLPGGRHDLYTIAESSIPALQAAMELLRPGGMISLCIYYGGQSGFAERDALLPFLCSIDPQRFTVVRHEFCNRPNCPPIVAEIYKHDPSVL